MVWNPPNNKKITNWLFFYVFICFYFLCWFLGVFFHSFTLLGLYMLISILQFSNNKIVWTIKISTSPALKAPIKLWARTNLNELWSGSTNLFKSVELWNRVMDASLVPYILIGCSYGPINWVCIVSARDRVSFGSIANSFLGGGGWHWWNESSWIACLINP